MAQLPLGSKWSQVLNNLNKQEEAMDEKDNSNVLEPPKDVDRNSSTSVNISMSSFGLRLKFFDDLLGCSPSTR